MFDSYLFATIQTRPTSMIFLKLIKLATSEIYNKIRLFVISNNVIFLWNSPIHVFSKFRSPSPRNQWFVLDHQPNGVVPPRAVPDSTRARTPQPILHVPRRIHQASYQGGHQKGFCKRSVLTFSKMTRSLQVDSEHDDHVSLALIYDSYLTLLRGRWRSSTVNPEEADMIG